MKRTKLDKIFTLILWITLLCDLYLFTIIHINIFLLYLSIILCSISIIGVSGKTYKRKFIALFLFSLIKLNKNYIEGSGFCSLIYDSFNIKWCSKSSLFLTDYISYIKPNDPTIEFNDPLMKTMDFWFNPYDWDIRIKYLKSILKE